MTVFFCSVLGIYFLWVIILWIGWKRGQKCIGTPVLAKHKQFITVIIPFRNEIQNYKSLLASLCRLNYPKDKFELLFVNDHSTDGSDTAIQMAIATLGQSRFIELDEDVEGKKAALTKGIAQAQGTIIATTDADCLVPANWLLRINEAFQTEEVKIVFGGVSLRKESALFSAIQALEFSSLVGAGASLLNWGLFIMCNGANMAFLRSTFNWVNGYQGNTTIASGDDVFLAEKIITLFPGSIRFIYRRDAVVITAPQPSIQAWVSQRVRWAGKWKYSKLTGVKWIAILVAAFQCILLFLLASLVLKWVDWRIGGLLLGGKMLVEQVFLFSIGRFLNLKWSWAGFFILQLTYPFYVIGIGLLAQQGTYRWKGRRLLHKM